MRIHDITLTITPNLPVWPGDPPIYLERVAKIEAGDNANVSQLGMSAHAGTHLDAPYHFLADSPVTVEQLDLKVLTGPAVVLELGNEVNRVTADVLKNARIPPRTRRLLLKTRNSQLWHHLDAGFQTDFTALDPDAAAYLVRRGVRLIGIDYLSVAPYHESRPTHETLLRAGVIIVEGLDLRLVSPGRYQLFCLPLKLGGADGAPVRAILLETGRN